MKFILLNKVYETKGEFMKMRLGTGNLYFIGLRADINGDPYLIIKTITKLKIFQKIETKCVHLHSNVRCSIRKK